MNRWRYHQFLLMIAALLACCPSAARGQGNIYQGAEIKAGIVALMGKLVTWPSGVAPTGGTKLTIGILGPDPFQASTVNHLDRKLVGQNVNVQRFNTPEDYKPCHILVVSRTADFQAAVSKTQGNHVLLIAEGPGLAKQGAVINLVEDLTRNQVRMEINPDAVRREGLTINPGVYRLPTVTIVR
jgi:hypothetical protein